MELCATNLIQDTVQGKNADSFAGAKIIALPSSLKVQRYLWFCFAIYE